MAEEKKEVKKEALWKRAWDKYEEAFDFVVEHRVGLVIFGIAVGIIALNKKVDKLTSHLDSLQNGITEATKAVDYNFDMLTKSIYGDSDGGDI